MNREALLSSVDKEQIYRGIISGGVYTATARSVALLVQVVVGIIQARYLTPAEFGLFGMVTTITSFIVIFRELGLSYATIQKQEITYEQLNALFWINALFGLILSLFTAASAWPMGALYKTNEVIPLTLAMSTVFIMSGISVQHAAVLKRKLYFKKMAIAEVGSAIIGALIGLLLVLQGAGVWALVMMQIVKAAVYNILVWVYLPWLPSKPKYDSEIRAMVNFGSSIMAFDFINYFSKNVDKILIGRFYGSGILGVYGKALELITLPITQIRGPLTVVAIPALSKFQKDGPRFSSFFITITQVNAALCIPSMLWLALASDFLVPLLLGKQWVEAIPFFRLLAIAGIFQSTVGILGTMLIALGNSRRYLAWGLWHGAAMVMCYCTVLFTAPINMIKLFVFVNALVFVPSAYYCASGSPVSTIDFLKAHIMPLKIGGLSLLIWLSTGFISDERFTFLVFVGRSALFFTLPIMWLLLRWRGHLKLLRTCQSGVSSIFSNGLKP